MVLPDSEIALSTQLSELYRKITCGLLVNSVPCKSFFSLAKLAYCHFDTRVFHWIFVFEASRSSPGASAGARAHPAATVLYDER